MGGYLFRLHVYESWVGISFVEVYEGIGKFDFWVCERAQRANTLVFWVDKVKKTFYFCDWFLFKNDSAFTVQYSALKGMQSSKQGMWKGYKLPIGGYYERGTFFGYHGQEDLLLAI